MSEHSRTSNVRGYQMRKRAEDVSRTRQRIVEAAVHLHGTVGPAATTVSAIAEQAAVTRLTVYRHFPDAGSLFAACSEHWAAGQHLPDPGAWTLESDPIQRVRAGLADLYRFYREAEPMLTRVRRDRDHLPPELRQRTAATEASYRDILLEPFEVSGRRRRRLQAAVGHAISFWTWRSLCVDHALTDAEAVEAMTTLVAGTARQPAD